MLPSYEYTFTVDDVSMTPSGPLDCGVSGDNGAAVLRFVLPDPDSVYRLEAVLGDGAYDITEPLEVTDGIASFDLPFSWTTAGMAAVRLVEEYGDRRRHYPAVVLRFAYREEGVPSDAPLCWQSLLSRTETALAAAERTAHEAGVSATQAEGFAVMAASEANEAKVAAERAAGNANAAERAEAAALQAEAAVAYCESLIGMTEQIKAVLGV